MPRAGLTTEIVVAEAAALADEEGLDSLRLAVLAERLGVAAPSLYKHVDGQAGLHRGLALLATRELGGALTTASVGRSRGDALRALSGAYREYAHTCPGRYAATVRAPDPADRERIEATDAVLRVVLAVLAGYGLDGDDAIHATRALRSALHGFVSLEATGGFGLPQDIDESFDRLVETFDLAFTDRSG